ncbi:MAG: DoxX family protein [Chloroflexi bacterium]|nr:DoxX family protein [Chloroflexota bacterium]
MNTRLWIAQGILAVMFLMAEMMKLMQSKEKMAWIEDFSQGQIRGIDMLEALGVLGLVSLMFTDIMPILTPWAAIRLALTMVGAFMTHLRRKEMVPIDVMNMILFAIAAFVAYGRF